MVRCGTGAPGRQGRAPRSTAHPARDPRGGRDHQGRQDGLRGELIRLRRTQSGRPEAAPGVGPIADCNRWIKRCATPPMRRATAIAIAAFVAVVFAWFAAGDALVQAPRRATSACRASARMPIPTHRFSLTPCEAPARMLTRRGRSPSPLGDAWSRDTENRTNTEKRWLCTLQFERRCWLRPARPYWPAAPPRRRVRKR